MQNIPQEKLAEIHDTSAQVDELLQESVQRHLFDQLFQPQTRDLAPSAPSDQAEEEWQGHIKFVQFHLPNVRSGRYQVEARQEVKVKGEEVLKAVYTNPAFEFRVATDRYELPLQQRHFMYPPDGEKGSYTDVIPHLVVRRSTLPWEQESIIAAPDAQSGHSQPSWLLLLVLTEDEHRRLVQSGISPETAGVSKADDTDLEKKKASNFLRITKDNRALFLSLLPETGDVAYLAHTIITKDTPESEHEEMAVVLANRLPLAGQKHHAHLVSIDGGLFPATATLLQAKEGEASTAEWDRILAPLDTGQAAVFFPSLFNWTFEDEASGESGFIDRLQNKTTVDNYRMTYSDEEGAVDSKLKSYLERGFVPLPHYMRRGDRTISWYHGPLVPAFSAWNSAVAVDNYTSADDYLLYEQNSKLLDASYAAAWQLGQNLTLQNVEVAKALYRWRRQTEQQRKNELLQSQNNSIVGRVMASMQESNRGGGEIPPLVLRWLEELFQLKHIPFNYLCPHPSMLPQDALRLVKLDYNWIQALLDGALSVGRNPTQVKAKGFERRDSNSRRDIFPPMVGFFLRSRAVGDYPDLHYHLVSSEKEYEEELLRYRFADDTELRLFQLDKPDEMLEHILVFGKPRSRYFGFIDNGENLVKLLRANTEDETNDNRGTALSDSEMSLPPAVVVPATKRIRIQQLVQHLEAHRLAYNQSHEPAIEGSILHNSARLAFHLIEGTPRVKFSKV